MMIELKLANYFETILFAISLFFQINKCYNKT